MKYRVTYHYAAIVRVDVDAEDEKQAEGAGMAEAAEGVDAALELRDVTVRPIRG